MSLFSATAFGKASPPTSPWPVTTAPPLTERRKASPWCTAEARGRVSSRLHRTLKTSPTADTMVCAQKEQRLELSPGVLQRGRSPGPWGTSRLPEAKRSHVETWPRIFSIHTMTKGTHPWCLISTGHHAMLTHDAIRQHFRRTLCVCVCLSCLWERQTLSHKEVHEDHSPTNRPDGHTLRPLERTSERKKPEKMTQKRWPGRRSWFADWSPALTFFNQSLKRSLVRSSCLFKGTQWH